MHEKQTNKETPIFVAFFVLSFQISNQIQDFTENSCRLDGLMLGRSWLTMRFFLFFFTTQEREIGFMVKLRRGRDLMNLGESVSHVPVVWYFFPFFLFRIPHQKEGSHFIKETRWNGQLTNFSPHFHGNGEELLVALCFQYSAPRCFFNTGEGRAYRNSSYASSLLLSALTLTTDSVTLDGCRLVKLWRRLTCRLTLEEVSLVICHALMSYN